MDIYDYQNYADSVDRLSEMLDNLSQEEASATLKIINELKEQDSEEKQNGYAAWFDAAILPCLKAFAEMTSSILTIEKTSVIHIVATLRNSCGINITESYRYMKSLLLLADDIGIDTIEGAAVLTLVFDDISCLG